MSVRHRQLAACGSDPAAVTEGNTTVVVEESGAAHAGGTAPSVATPDQDIGGSVSILEDGVLATIGDDDTRGTADVDGNPSIDVQVD